MTLNINHLHRSFLLRKNILFLFFICNILLCFVACSGSHSDRKKIDSLYQKKAEAKNGDWLAEHKEAYHDFETYQYSKPIRPDKQRKVIYIYKLGDNTGAEDSLLQITRSYLEKVFHLETKIAEAFPFSLVPDSMQRSWSDGSVQVRTGFILNKLQTLPIPTDAAVALCFTKYDLYPGPNWNFVFGEAYIKRRVGVWSFNRYGNANDKAEFKAVLRRTLKVASHETGHMFSITHCTRYECDMNVSNSLKEMDGSTLHYCPDCLEKLSWNIGFDLESHFKGLMDFYGMYGFDEEADFMKKNIQALRGD